MEQVRNGVHAKLLWLVLEDKFLWPQYARSKYFRDSLPYISSQASPLWNAIVTHYPTLCEQSRWIIGAGEILFRRDNWAGERLEGPQPYDETLTVAQGLQILEELQEYIPTHFITRIKKVQLDITQPDRLVFTATESGKYNSKAFKALVRPHGIVRTWAKCIWHRSLPPNISAFLWKALRHAVPIDSRVKSKGIVMASRCHCCKDFKEETLNNLFLQSEVATAVWTCSGNIFKIPYMFGSIPQAIQAWTNIKVHASQFEFCKLSTMAYIFHEIWVSRCRARFDGMDMHARQLCLRIISKVQLHSLVVVSLSKSTPIQYHALEILGIARTRIKSKPGRWFRWEKPLDGYYKLNVDGSAHLEAITGGGIIHDLQGLLVAAFSSSYVQGTNNIAEFAALLEGLQLCRDLDLHNVIIESDSSIVVLAMKQKQVENWKLT